MKKGEYFQSHYFSGTSYESVYIYEYLETLSRQFLILVPILSLSKDDLLVQKEIPSLFPIVLYIRVIFP